MSHWLKHTGYNYKISRKKMRKSLWFWNRQTFLNHKKTQTITKKIDKLNLLKLKNSGCVIHSDLYKQLALLGLKKEDDSSRNK